MRDTQFLIRDPETFLLKEIWSSYGGISAADREVLAREVPLELASLLTQLQHLTSSLSTVALIV